MSLMIFGIMAALILVLGSGAYVILNRAQNKRMRERTMSVIRGHAQTESKVSEKDIKDKRRAEIARKLKDSAHGENKPKKKNDLKSRLVQAGLKINVRQFWLFSILFAVVATLLAKFAGQNIVVCTLVGFAGLFGAPRFFLKSKAKRRQKAFLEDFADALEAMVRLLKAGMPVGEAILMASREFEGPIGEEMSRIYEEQKIGVTLPEAVMEAARRMPITEMQMFATAITIQSQTGSSLSEILINLAKTIRARFRLRRKVQALSSEAKASAMIIGALPFLVGGGMYLINKEYIEILFITPKGNAWLIGSGIWMFIGCMVMRQMINFRI